MVVGLPAPDTGHKSDRVLETTYMVAISSVRDRARQASSTYYGHNIVFIVGSPRSGTTWLQRLLASHPMVRTGQESYVFEYIRPQVRRWSQHLEARMTGGRGGVGLPCYFSETEYMEVLHEYLTALLAPMIGNLLPGELFVEKTPGHALRLPEIGQMLPEARIIHLLRDPRDVTASLIAASKGWGARWAPRNAASAAKMWKQHVWAVQQAVPAIPAGQYLEVRYEELHASTADTFNRVLDFLSLEWDAEEVLDAVARNSADQIRAGGGTGIPVGGEFETASGVVVEPPGFARKARPNAWKEDLSHIERVQVWLVARKLMAKTGYEWKAPW